MPKDSRVCCSHDDATDPFTCNAVIAWEGVGVIYAVEAAADPVCLRHPATLGAADMRVYSSFDGVNDTSTVSGIMLMLQGALIVRQCNGA